MDISQRGIDLILASEGKYKLMPDGRYKAYLDTLAKPPVPTIYCGLTKGVTMDMVITVAEGDKMFAKELAVYEDAIDRLVAVPLNQNQFDALCSFTYNCGVGALQNSTLLKLLNQGKYDQVPAQLMKWTHAGGKEYPGLVTRRKAEGALFMEPMPEEHTASLPKPTEEHPDPQPQMPQRVEVNNPSAVSIVANSTTAKSAGVGIAAVALQIWNSLFGAVRDAGPEILQNQQALGPFESLFKAVGANLGLLAACVAGASLVVVIVRKIAQERG